MYQCPNCSGNLKFDIARQKLYCEYCETVLDPYSVEEEHSVEEKKDEYEATMFICPQCGGRILSEDTTAATFCSFCGAATILESRVCREKRPACILPFSRTKEDCKKSYAALIRRAIFAPRELTDPEHIEKFRGIYMPYWVYSFGKDGPASFTGSRSYRRGDYVYTKYYDLDCEVQASYEGMAYDASASFSDDLSQSLAPFDLRERKDFTPAFLSGFYADTADVEKRVYESDAEELMREDSYQRLKKDKVFHKYKTDKINVKNAVAPTKAEASLAMLPVWFLAYRHKDRIAYAVVNGQTGKASADIPIDPVRYLTGSGILAVLLFVMLNLFFTLTPVRLLILVILLAAICFLVTGRQVIRLAQKESGATDKGKQEAKPGRPAAPEERADLAAAMADGREKEKKSREDKEKKKLSPLAKALLFIAALQLAGPLLMKLAMVGTTVFSSMAGGSRYRVSYVIFLTVVIYLFIGVGLVRLLTQNRRSRKTPLDKETRKKKWMTQGKPLLGILCAIVIILFNPASDLFYYIGATVCMLMILWAILDIFRQHNILTTRKLPQLGKRGGDENA